jgi:hypothetical protein
MTGCKGGIPFGSQAFGFLGQVLASLGFPLDGFLLGRGHHWVSQQGSQRQKARCQVGHGKQSQALKHGELRGTGKINTLLPEYSGQQQ